MKIAICGVMCSGKTTLADYIVSKNLNYHKTSFANKVKELAVELFGMECKNRKLLIDIGTKMREIDENVWVNYTIKECQQYENSIIDDLRNKNEFDILKKEKWIVIKLVLDEQLQKERLINTYPENWKEHYQYIKNEKEIINKIPEDLFDYIYVIDKHNQEGIFNNIENIICEK